MATAERPLRREELVTLAILGVPTCAFALAITTVSTNLPVLASSSDHPRAPVRALILSMHDNEQYFFEALRAGASGYVLKSKADTISWRRAARRCA